MWYYIVVTFVLLGCLLFARINSAYHPDLLIKKHIVIKRKGLARLLIMESDPRELKIDNKEKYRDKLLILGLICYVLWAVLVIFSVLFLVFGPVTEIEPFEFDDGFFVSALNQAVVFMCTLAFLGFEMAFYFLNILCSPSVNENKFVRVLWYFVVVSVFLISVFAVIETVKLFF